MGKEIKYIELEDHIYYSESIIDWMDNISDFPEEVDQALACFYGDMLTFPEIRKGVFRTNYTDVVIKISEGGSIQVCLASEEE